MQYMGSKNRIAKHILPIMLAERKPEQWWVEPFVGGANMIDKVDGKRLGNDSHEFLISLLTAISHGYIPPYDISKELYYSIKSNPQDHTKELVGFVGFLCSFGNKWWGGYASNSDGRNYATVAVRSLVKQAKNLSGVVFKCGSFLELEIPNNSLIYCDPPYANTCKYAGEFNHDMFWDWCRKQTEMGHTVFISEYSAPNDFVCIKEVQHVTNLDKNGKDQRIEKLFRYVA